VSIGLCVLVCLFFFSSRRRHTRFSRDWSSDVCSSDLGLAFEVDVVQGQKTGYFLDQKVNRTLLAPLVEGARVLDVFCHTGSFSVHALHYGAREVTGIDSSEQAVAAAQRNVERNGLGDRARFEVANAFDRLRELEREGERFDCVILDPPAFAKGKAHVEAAARGYK